VNEPDLVASRVTDQKTDSSNVGHEFDHELEREQDPDNPVSRRIQQSGENQAAAELYNCAHTEGERR
jgi:hypothetical protein